MSHRSSSHANDSANSESEPEASSSSCLMSCEIMLQVATWLKTFEEFTRGWVRLGYLDVDTQTTIMAGRSTRSNTANNINPPNEIADEVTRQLNTALPNQLTQLVQALRGNRTNQREVTQSCSIKIFRASGAKEFFGTEGAIGLLTWFESIESVLHITKCPTERQVEFASSMLQGRALTWWNTLVQTRGRAAAIA
ncbi:hypothetical protein Tco_0355161 [Tanacetum coccineum]